MVFQNKNSNTPSSGGSGFIKFSEGVVLTPAAGVITPTDTCHHVAAGTVSTIATTNLDTNVQQFFLMIADGAITITLGATIIGHTTSLLTNEALLYILDGGTAWREVPVHVLAVADVPNLPASKITSGQLALARGGTNADLSATGGSGQIVKQSTVGGTITVALLTAGEIPVLPASIITSGQLALARGGTNADLSATGGASQVLKQVTAGAAVTVAQLAASDLSNGVTGSGAAVLASSPAIVTPTIASFANATHNHTNAAGGGQLTLASLSDFTDWATFTPSLTSATGTFSGGSVGTKRWRKQGKKLSIELLITGATITGTPAWVGFTIPGGFTAANVTYFGAKDGRNNGTLTWLSNYVDGTTVVKFTVLAEGTGNWTASAANADISCCIEFETTA